MHLWDRRGLAHRSEADEHSYRIKNAQMLQVSVSRVVLTHHTLADDTASAPGEAQAKKSSMRGGRSFVPDKEDFNIGKGACFHMRALIAQGS